MEPSQDIYSFITAWARIELTSMPIHDFADVGVLVLARIEPQHDVQEDHRFPAVANTLPAVQGLSSGAAEVPPACGLRTTVDGVSE